jgi:hypothetical protein
VRLVGRERWRIARGKGEGNRKLPLLAGEADAKISGMAMTFDVTLKDMVRDSPHGFLTAFDRPPTQPVQLLNVDLSTVTSVADVVLGLGDPLEEIIQMDFQSSAAAEKHAALMAYHALLYAHYLVPVHTVIVLLRPQAAHSNLSGSVRYAPRPGRGKMDFDYEVVPLWQLPAEVLLAADPGVAPLAVLGRLPEGLTLEEGLAAVAQRVAERLTQEVPAERAKRLLTDTFLLTGMRVRRNVATEIFRGIRVMQESDTYLAILDEGEEKGCRVAILIYGEELLGPPAEAVRAQLNAIADLPRLRRMIRQTAKAATWKEIIETP